MNCHSSLEMSRSAPVVQTAHHNSTVHHQYLQAVHHLLHLVPAQVKKTLDQVSVNEASRRVRLAVSVKRSPTVVEVKASQPLDEHQCR